MLLSEKIANYYFANLGELDADKRFHYATRLAAWRNDPRAVDYLRQVRSEFVPEPFDADTFRASLRQLIEQPVANPINALELRQPYFERYPRLRGIDFALFRVRHIETLYGVDTRAQLLSIISEQELSDIHQRLTNDDEALRILSTYAINYIYLLQRVIFRNTNPETIDIGKLYDLGDAYDLTNPQHIQLLIYLYTHCIIGETNFYVRPIPEQLLPDYTRMVKRLETLITDHFTAINLDNKLEFLVCCRITGYDTSLFERVYAECDDSVSSEGLFLVDRHNANAQSDKTSLAASEHRNVLYIMSNSPYAPHMTVI